MVALPQAPPSASNRENRQLRFIQRYPSLRAENIIMMDNLAAHKNDQTVALIAGVIISVPKDFDRFFRRPE